MKPNSIGCEIGLNWCSECPYKLRCEECAYSHIRDEGAVVLTKDNVCEIIAEYKEPKCRETITKLLDEFRKEIEKEQAKNYVFCEDYYDNGSHIHCKRLGFCEYYDNGECRKATRYYSGKTR